MVDERRRDDRIDTAEIGLQVVNRIDNEPFGIISNLSSGGMMLITNRELFAGGVLQLMLQTPDNADLEPISMGMKILWCTPAASEHEYWAGLETIDIDAPGLTRLNTLIDRLNKVY